jgi:hypothetical protein
MNHPNIINAFKNARTRNEDSIYMVFQRNNMYYTNTYIIMAGTEEKIKKIISTLYNDTTEYKKENLRGDHDSLDDTPFDTWCGGKCVNDIKGYIHECPDENNLSCCSHWEHFEYASEVELNKRVEAIPKEPCYYNHRTMIDYRLIL